MSTVNGSVRTMRHRTPGTPLAPTDLLLLNCLRLARSWVGVEEVLHLGIVSSTSRSRQQEEAPSNRDPGLLENHYIV